MSKQSTINLLDRHVSIRKLHILRQMVQGSLSFARHLGWYWESGSLLHGLSNVVSEIDLQIAIYYQTEKLAKSRSSNSFSPPDGAA